MRTENSSTFIRPKIGQQTEIAGKFHNSNNACAHIIYIIIYLTLAIRNVLYCLDVVRHSNQPAGQPASVTHSVWSMIFILPVGSSFRQMNEYYVCGWKSHTHTSAICTDDKYGRWHWECIQYRPYSHQYRVSRSDFSVHIQNVIGASYSICGMI